MTTHILAITYQPKIEGIKNGTIRQTIRPLSKVPRKVGDKLILHGWQGKPYRSSWSWRKEVIIGWVMDLFVRDYGFAYWEAVRSGHPWGSIEANALAERDGISPPTGLELKKVLESYHGKFTDKPVQMQVIRW